MSTTTPQQPIQTQPPQQSKLVIDESIKETESEINNAKNMLIQASNIFVKINDKNYKTSLDSIDVISTNLLKMLNTWLVNNGNKLSLNQTIIAKKTNELNTSLATYKRIFNNDKAILEALLTQTGQLLNYSKTNLIPQWLKFGLDDTATESATLGVTLNKYSITSRSTFDDIIGYDDIKDKIRLQLHPLFKMQAKHYQKLLMYGPPGNGKTQMAKAIASELGASLVVLTPANLLLPTLGESEKIIHNIFTEANETTQQIVIFIDEMETIFDRSASSAEYNRSITSQFLTEVNTNLRNHIFIIGATNFLDKVDEAVKSRLNNEIQFKNPDVATHFEILNAKFNKTLDDSVKALCRKNEEKFKKLSARDTVEIGDKIKLAQIQDLVDENTQFKIISDWSKNTFYNIDDKQLEQATGGFFYSHPHVNSSPILLTKDTFADTIKNLQSTLSVDFNIIYMIKDSKKFTKKEFDFFCPRSVSHHLESIISNFS